MRDLFQIPLSTSWVEVAIPLNTREMRAPAEETRHAWPRCLGSLFPGGVHQLSATNPWPVSAHCSFRRALLRPRTTPGRFCGLTPLKPPSPITPLPEPPPKSSAPIAPPAGAYCPQGWAQPLSQHSRPFMIWHHLPFQLLPSFRPLFSRPWAVPPPGLAHASTPSWNAPPSPSNNCASPSDTVKDHAPSLLGLPRLSQQGEHWPSPAR